MNQNLWLAGWINLGSLLVIAVAALPMALGKTRRNRFYGYRTPKSQASDENWDQLNRYAGRALLFWLIPFFIFSQVMLAGSFIISFETTRSFMIVLFSLPTIPALGATVQTLIHSKNL